MKNNEDIFNIKEKYPNELGEALKLYIDTLIVKDRAFNTVKSYYLILDSFYRFIINNDKIYKFSQLKTIHLSKFYIYSQVTLNNSSATIENKKIVINQFFSFLEEQGIIAPGENPTPKEETIKSKSSTKTKLPTFLESEEIGKFFSVVNQEPNKFQRLRDYNMFALLFNTGLRVSELTNLTIFELEYLRQNGTLVIKGKGNVYRTIAVSKKAFTQGYLSKIDEYLELRKKYENPKEIPESKTALFLSRQGTKLTTRSVQRSLVKYIKKSDIIKHITPHSFRHTFATQLLKNGINIRVVQQILGHASIGTTQVYTHVLTSDVQDAAESITSIQFH